MDRGPLMASWAAWVACWSVESMASISAASAGFWARHAVAIERATSTAVAAAASLDMGSNLTVMMFDVAVVGAGPAGATTALTLARRGRSEEHTSELQSRFDLVCRLLLEKKKTNEMSNML